MMNISNHIIDPSSIDLDKLEDAVHIDAFRKNKFVNKEVEIPPGINPSFAHKGH